MPRSTIGRIGRWCSRRWWWVLVAWLIAIGAGIAATGPLFGRLADAGPPHSVESVVANDVLSQGGNTGGTVIGVVDRADPRSPAVRAAVTAVAAQLAAIPDVARVDHPFEVGLAPAVALRLVEPDGQAFLVSVTLADVPRARRDAATAAITADLHALTADLPGDAVVEVGGGPALNLRTRTLVRQDLERAEYSSLPVTLIVLIVVFGGLVAAGLPVLTAAASVAAAMGVLLGFSTFTDVAQDGVTVVTLLGLGLSIDYGLLLVARYREELMQGWAPDVAVARAWATAGRTILFSALTVAASLSGLLTFRLPTLTALGAAGVSIAVVAMVGSLTLTAALIGLLRRWIRPSRRRRRGGGAADDERGFFAGLSRLVQRRPVLVVVVTAAALLAAGAPLLSASVRLPGLGGIPSSEEPIRVATALADRFGRPAAPPITVVARADPGTLAAWADRWRADPEVAAIRPAQSVAGGSASSVGIDVVGDPQGADARALVGRIRADRPPGGPSWVTGDAAVLTDLLGLIGGALPAALGITVVAMVALLFAMTGSLVVPLKAILANVVSLGATFGVLTAVFAHGLGSGLLDTLTVGALNPFIVVLVFAFAFGLSMDYEVFLLGRIKEQVDAGMNTDAAVRRGLQRTGRVITSAALLMMIVFSCFAAARVGNVEQIGLGLTVAVLIDATIVRCLLVPATMTLLGRWNWWAPVWLTRLRSRIGLREQPLPTRAEAPVRPERDPAPA